MKFTEKDLIQIKAKGLSLEEIEKQLELFKSGLPFSNIQRAATQGDGVLTLGDDKKNELIYYFESELDGIEIIKFVPASGAATRMFKFLFEFVKSYDPKEQSINRYINTKKDRALYTFFVGLEKFPFYHSVVQKLKELYPDFQKLNDNEQSLLFVKTMLDSDKLDYGNYPKGLLPFHEYKNQVISTAFEEHLFETALYSSKKRPTKIHFTISEKYRDKFREEFKRIEKKVEEITGSTFDISFSYQMGSTDTIAVSTKDQPIRNEDGSLMFRPSGHGALLENLNRLDADIIFIKNIDNVVVNKYKEDVAESKKMLAGLLLKLRKKIFDFLIKLEGEIKKEEELSEIVEYIQKELFIQLTSDFYKYKLRYQVEHLKNILNRPIRVCGMVLNEGEPGGGPFYVKDENGRISLQIVESAQIDSSNKNQKSILKNSTHFNPVDIVCSVRDYKGNKFNLHDYVNENTAFITMKTKVGKHLKALELPGLWNGGMAHWITVFVEVPIITFNPVKTVNDLLKAPHQLRE